MERPLLNGLEVLHKRIEVYRETVRRSNGEQGNVMTRTPCRPQWKCVGGSRLTLVRDLRFNNRLEDVALKGWTCSAKRKNGASRTWWIWLRSSVDTSMACFVGLVVSFALLSMIRRSQSLRTKAPVNPCGRYHEIIRPSSGR